MAYFLFFSFVFLSVGFFFPVFPLPRQQLLKWSAFFYLLVALFSLKSSRTRCWIEKFMTGKYQHRFFLFWSLLIAAFHFLFFLQNLQDSFFLVDTDFVGLAEVILNSINGKWFFAPHYGNGADSNYLAHHFAPGLLLFSPFMPLSDYRLGYGYGLLFYQSLAFLIFYRIFDHLGFFTWEKIIWLFFWLTNLFVYRLFHSLHFESLFLVFFLLFFLGYLEKKPLYWLSGFLLSLILKEDIALYFVGFSAFLWWNKDYKISTLIFVASISYYFLLLPALRADLDPSASVNWLSGWSRWGKDYLSILTGWFWHPLTLWQVVSSHSARFWQFIWAFGGLWLLAVGFWPLLAFLLMLHFSSERIWYNEFYNYYCYTILPFLLSASLIGYQKIRTAYPGQPAILLIVLAFSLYQTASDPLTPLPARPIDSKKIAAIRSLNVHIPVGRTVSSQFDLSGWVKRTNPVYPLQKFTDLQEYILIAPENAFSPFVNQETLQTLLKKMQKSANFQNLDKQQGIYLFRNLNKKFIDKKLKAN